MCPSNEVCNEYARTLIRVKAKQVVRGRGFNRSDLPDVEQELYFHLVKQAPNFDPERSSLNTFITTVVDSAVGMIVRQRGREKRSPSQGAQIQSLDTKVEDGRGALTPLWATLLPEDRDRKTAKASMTDAEVLELVDSVRFLIEGLPPHLQQICQQLMRTSQAEATRELKISRRKLTMALEEIRSYVGRLSQDSFQFSAQPRRRTS